MDAKGLLQEHYSRNTKSLFKHFLILLEDLQLEHCINFAKLKRNLPAEHKALVDQADYFDRDKMQYLRKKVLDIGNEAVRSNSTDLERFEIYFEFKNNEFTL